MSENTQKINTAEKPTLIGRFAVWADGVEIRPRRKIIALAFLVGLSSLVVYEQKNNWNFFKVRSTAMAESELPQFTPSAEILAGTAMRSEQKSEEQKYILGDYSLGQFALMKNIEKLVDDKPMEKMVEAVSKRDLQTASYLVAIAKKESNLGKFSPKKNGKDCFNYWGFRGSYNRTASGYSCFDSPEQAVKVVGDRIQYLAKIRNYNTPQKMSVWKCGFNCSWDNPTAVKKWVSDVSFYYKKVNNAL